jgi:hypothetical protein
MKRREPLKRGNEASTHWKHSSRYKKEFLNNNGYLYCELCKRSDKIYDTHRIMSAGRYPKHKYLHNPINMILLCRECHEEVHAGKALTKIIEERSLRELFGEE